MKKILILSLLIIFGACSKNEENNTATLNINNTQWYLTRTNYGGGVVHLKIEGSTNSDKVTIRTFGDGVRSDENVELYSKKRFNADVVISFTATSIPSGEFEITTLVMAYKGSDTLKVPIISGKLKY